MTSLASDHPTGELLGGELAHSQAGFRSALARYRDLVERLPIVTYVDAADERTTPLYVSPQIESLVGYTPEEWLAHPGVFYGAVHPDDRVRVDEAFGAPDDGRDRISIEYRLVARDGRIVWVRDELAVVRDESGRPVYHLGFVRDITEQKLVEAALRGSEARYRLLFDQSPSPMWVHDARTLRFVDANEAAVRAYGYTLAELRRMTVSQIEPGDEDLPLLGDLAVPEPCFRDSGVRRHRRKDGGVVEVSVLSAAIDLDGRPARLVLAQDVTAQRQLDERLRQAHKLEAVGRLAGGIAHEYNNLLTVVLGYATLAAERLARGEDPAEELEEVKRAAEQGSALARQLLAFGGGQVARPALLDLNAVVLELEPLLRRLVGEDVELVTALEPSLARVEADRAQLEQVVVNLVVNAREAMPAGGRIAIDTANADLANDPSGGSARYAVLSVTDTGVGMDDGTRARAFEPFFTTKGRSRGLGLGLSAAYGIVEQSGGHIAVESAPGHGACFRVFLPAAATDASAGEDAVGGNPAAGGAETVLVAEDEPAVRALVGEVLEAAGYRVVRAADGEEALRRAAGLDDLDLLVADVVMPALGGLELAERLRANRPGLRVLFMSGHDERGAEALVRPAPGQDFIRKPFSPGELARRVRSLLDARR